MSTTHLFFYGTLMSDFCRGSVLRDRPLADGSQITLAEPVATGEIRGDLFAVGTSFPALVEGDGVVKGEVWRAPTEQHLQAALNITDAIEGYRGPGVPSNLYDRIEVPLLRVWGDLRLAPGDTVLTYRWNPRQRFGALDEKIEDGGWRRFAAALALGEFEGVAS